ncbi:MAG: hypothetical protein II001_05150 [Bacteroidales bacterium]|nr:hypothetical protein [Bacteroidales bacterium]
MTPFQEFVQNMPHRCYATFRNMVKREMLAAEISISDQAFRNWERGVYEPDTAQKREIINRCAQAVVGKTIY